MDESREAFTGFVVEHEQRLLGTAYLLTGDFGHAQDLVQTALAKAYRHWAWVSAADHPVAYVRRTMVNTHVSWLRRLSSTERVSPVVADRADDDPQAALAVKDEVRRALLQLSPRVRAALVLRYFEDLTEVETARLMGCATSTVSTYTARGLAALRRALGHTDDDAPVTTSEGRRT